MLVQDPAIEEAGVLVGIVTSSNPWWPFTRHFDFGLGLRYTSAVMGITYVTVSIANPATPTRLRRKKLLADSGPLYSIIPKEVLKAVGIKPYGRETFTLADGSGIQRDVGTAFLRINGRKAPSPVIFGEKNDGALLGVIALESLGFSIDPRTGKLKPTPLFLM